MSTEWVTPPVAPATSRRTSVRRWAIATLAGGVAFHLVSLFISIFAAGLMPPTVVGVVCWIAGSIVTGLVAKATGARWLLAPVLTFGAAIAVALPIYALLILLGPQIMQAV